MGKLGHLRAEQNHESGAEGFAESRTGALTSAAGRMSGIREISDHTFISQHLELIYMLQHQNIICHGETNEITTHNRR